MPAGAVEPDGVRTGQVMLARAAPALMLNYTFARESGTLVRDRSASGLNGELVGTSAPAAYVPGLDGHNQALKLIGVQHQYVDVGDAPGAGRQPLQPDRVGELHRGYERPDPWPLGGHGEGRRLLAEHPNRRSGASWRLLRWVCQPNWKYLDSPDAIPANTWTHLASTYNGSQLAVWVNGVKVASRAVTGATCVNAEPLAVGAKNAPAKAILEAFLRRPPR